MTQVTKFIDANDEIQPRNCSRSRKRVVANALSRNPLPHAEVDAITVKGFEDYVASIQELWPVSNDRINCLWVTIFKNHDLQWITKYVMHGWLEKVRMPSHLHKFAKVQRWPVHSWWPSSIPWQHRRTWGSSEGHPGAHPWVTSRRKWQYYKTKFIQNWSEQSYFLW